ncbi:hypothetical protein ABZW18_21115 [Streptomyces sp. NPDC004647]|uniref:hypothetical protein n=1 Tax=Streptomyces sp. NPDC004647 TaxID=3154671 RepID=UPI0033B35229
MPTPETPSAAAGPLQCFTVTVLLHVGQNSPPAVEESFIGCPMAEVTTSAGQVLRLRFEEAEDRSAADAAVWVGAWQRPDDRRQWWPDHVRPISAGDVLRVEDEAGRAARLAVGTVGFEDVAPPDSTVPLQVTTPSQPVPPGV